MEPQRVHSLWGFSCQPHYVRADSSRMGDAKKWTQSDFWSPRLVFCSCSANKSFFGKKDILCSYGFLSIESAWHPLDKRAHFFPSCLCYDPTISSRQNQTTDSYAWLFICPKSLQLLSKGSTPSCVWRNWTQRRWSVSRVDRVHHAVWRLSAQALCWLRWRRRTCFSVIKWRCEPSPHHFNICWTFFYLGFFILDMTEWCSFLNCLCD